MVKVLVVLALLGAAAFGAAAQGADRIAPVLEDDGIYTQSWFVRSFLDLNEDLADAHAEGKILVIVFEQKGCPYCREMHTGHLADARINEYVRSKFAILQLNIHGDREVTDFDGGKMAEKELARRWGARFTPTQVFFSAVPQPVAGKPAKQIEVLRMPGLLKPGAFYAMFKFVELGRYRDLSLSNFLDGEGAAIAKEIDDHPAQ